MCGVLFIYMCGAPALYVSCFFFFKQKTAYEMRISDWSSDVCSSDLRGALAAAVGAYEGDDLARLDGDIDAAHQPAPAALHAKPPRLDEGSLARRQPRDRKSVV